MELSEIVLRITGPVDPVGETNEDNRRIDNLHALLGAMRELHMLVDRIATENKDRREFSRERAGRACMEYLDWLGVEE